MSHHSLRCHSCGTLLPVEDENLIRESRHGPQGGWEVNCPKCGLAHTLPKGFTPRPVPLG